jgi:predicted transcriptional regulator
VYVVKVDGTKLKAARQRQLFTMVQAANLSGVSRETIRRLENENGGAQPGTLKQLGRIYQVDPHIFIAADVYEELDMEAPELEGV